MKLCDICQQAIERHGGFTWVTPMLGAYHVCDDCSLPLDRFTERIERARGRRIATIRA
jgi:hypothetical protein